MWRVPEGTAPVNIILGESSCGRYKTLNQMPFTPASKKLEPLKSERGVALILTIFIIALATLLVTEFTREINSYQRSSRNYVEAVQSLYVLTSAVNFAQVLLQVPKLPPTVNEDWLGEPWSLIAGAPVLPIEGFAGEMRMLIVDEDGKIDLNGIAPPNSTSANNSNLNGGFGQTAPKQNAPKDAPTFWQETVYNLFTLAGGFDQSQRFPEGSFRTLGDATLEGADQVAAMIDWIDADTESFSSPNFQGRGMEASSEKSWFFNRQLKSMSELAMVPGMTFERIQRIAPNVRVSQGIIAASQRTININTAPNEVLVALGFDSGQASEILQQREKAPINTQILGAYTGLHPELNGKIKINSQEFSVFAKVRLPTRTSWVKATIGLLGNLPNRQPIVRSIEFH